MRRAALMFSAAALCACSLVVGLDDLSSGSDAAASDVTSDVVVAFEAGVCDGVHLVCENFDEDGGAWSSKLQPVMNGATLAVGTDDFVSSPASLRIASDGGNNTAGYLLATLPQPLPNDFECKLAVRVEGIPSGKLVQTANIGLYSTDPNVSTYSLFFQGDPLSGQLYEFELMADGGLNESPKALPYSVVDGKWHNVAIAVHLGAPATAQMTLDDGLVTTRSISPPSTITGASFTIGIQYSNSLAGWTARIDDAFCNAL